MKWKYKWDDRTRFQNRPKIYWRTLRPPCTFRITWLYLATILSPSIYLQDRPIHATDAYLCLIFARIIGHSMFKRDETWIGDCIDTKRPIWMGEVNKSHWKSWEIFFMGIISRVSFPSFHHTSLSLFVVPSFLSSFYFFISRETWWTYIIGTLVNISWRVKRKKGRGENKLHISFHRKQSHSINGSRLERAIFFRRWNCWSYALFLYHVLVYPFFVWIK